ncbi:MAG: hypothetical protein AB7F79_08850 [Steroidobacteraceae bacterium]
MKFARPDITSVYLTCCIAEVFLAVPCLVVAQDLPTMEEPDSLSVAVNQVLPSDDQLEAAGARIGNVEINVEDVFDPNNPKERGIGYRAANYLHINTRESTVQTQLLFKSGDLYSRHVLDETARNLRARKYLVEARVMPLRYHADTNSVDLLVRVKDNWTLNPGGSFGRSGGENSSGLQLDEGNLFGFGKAVSVDYVKDVDRNAWKFAYRDPNLLSTRWEMQARYQQASDGGLRDLLLAHPFYSLNTRWSAAFNVADATRTDRRYSQGVVIDQYRTDLNNLEVQGGWSTGLRVHGDGPGWVQRWSLGWTQDQQRYSEDPSLGTTLLPANQQLRYPWLGLSWFEDRYRVTHNRDQITRTEDVYMGRALNLRIGYASESWGADRNAVIVGVHLQDAYQLGERHTLFVDVGLDGRRESNTWQGTLFSSGLRYDWQQGRNHILVIKFDTAHTENPDDSQQIHLGSDEGLRGYPLRYRSGTQRSVLQIEQRAYTDWQILRLLSVGGAAFVDVGRIRGGESVMPGLKRTFTDVGLGARLGNIRSSRGDVFHLDLAYPIDAVDSERKLQFSITTKASF